MPAIEQPRFASAARAALAAEDRAPGIGCDGVTRDYAPRILKTWVTAEGVGDSAMAYPRAWLGQILRHRGELRNTFGGHALRIRHDRSRAMAEMHDAQGRLLPGTPALCCAWRAFHPQADVLQAGR